MARLFGAGNRASSHARDAPQDLQLRRGLQPSGIPGSQPANQQLRMRCLPSNNGDLEHRLGAYRLVAGPVRRPKE